MSVQHLAALTDKPEPPQHDPNSLPPVRIGPFVFTPSGLVVESPDPTFNEWAAAMNALAVITAGLAFVVGDMIRFGTRYGEMTAQIIDAKSWSAETVRSYTWLAEKVGPNERMIDRGLSVSHHQAVGKMPPAEQRKWLKRALNDGGETWTVAQLKAAIREDSDVEASRWFVVVTCKTERDRDGLKMKLEADGYECKASERYTKVVDVKGEADEQGSAGSTGSRGRAERARGEAKPKKRLKKGAGKRT